MNFTFCVIFGIKKDNRQKIFVIFENLKVLYRNNQNVYFILKFSTQAEKYSFKTNRFLLYDMQM